MTDPGSRRGPRPWRTALAFTAALLALGAAGFGQERVFDATRVVEVRVPVQVTDRQGEPVRDLEVGDFQIVDGGKKREIIGFEVIDLDLVEPTAANAWGRRALPEAGRRHFLLLFDLSFSSPAAVLKACIAAREFVLSDLHPADLVAVATHSADRGARILMTFTADRGQTVRAIEAVPTSGLVSAGPRDPLAFTITETEAPSVAPSEDARTNPNNGGPALALSDREDLTFWVLDREMAKAEQSSSAGEVSSWAASLADLGRMLGLIRGRKQVLYFSEGFDGELVFGREQSVIDSGLAAAQRNQLMQRHWSMHTDDRFGSAGLLAEVDEALRQLRRSDCVLHAVDIAGLDSQSRRERDRKGRRHALFYISRETGGELFADGNRLRQHLGEVLERSAVTYLLSFAANDIPADGSFRPLKVRASLPDGGRLSSRDGYYAPRPFRELHPLERSLLASQAIASAVPVADLEMRLLAAPFRAAAGEAYVPVIIEVPGAPLLVDQQGGRLPVELYVYATDEAGQVGDFFTQLVTLDIARGRNRFRDSGVKFYGHLDLPPGEFLLRVLVRNGETGRTGLEARPLAIPDFDPREPVLLPPFFLETAGRWVLVREKEPPGEESVVYPFTAAGQPFIPAARPALAASEQVELCLVAYNLGRGDLRVDGVVLDPEGGLVDGGALAVVERTVTGVRGLDKLTATFSPAGLEPGDYLLQVSLTDPASGWTEVSTAPFTLRAPG